MKRHSRLGEMLANITAIVGVDLTVENLGARFGLDQVEPISLHYWWAVLEVEARDADYFRARPFVSQLHQRWRIEVTERLHAAIERLVHLASLSQGCSYLAMLS